MSAMHNVAQTSDVPPGAAIAVEVDGRKIALFNNDGTFYAIDDTCPHAGGPLSEGVISDHVVTCPWHGSSFKLTSGEVVEPPAADGVQAYKVQVDGDDVMIEVP